MFVGRIYFARALLFVTLSGSFGCDDDEPRGTSEASALETQAVVTFTYDALGRLRTVEYPQAVKRIVHTLDGAGNRTRRGIDQTITQPSPPLPVRR